jgi:hypothetical protein
VHVCITTVALRLKLKVVVAYPKRFQEDRRHQLFRISHSALLERLRWSTD